MFYLLPFWGNFLVQAHKALTPALAFYPHVLDVGESGRTSITHMFFAAGFFPHIVYPQTFWLESHQRTRLCSISVPGFAFMPAPSGHDVSGGRVSFNRRASDKHVGCLQNSPVEVNVVLLLLMLVVLGPEGQTELRPWF